MTRPSGTLVERARADVVLTAVALAFGASSLAHPFGRDQGLYFYVAREWVRRGAIPYRDVLDHKTPGIYVLHALVIRLFGEAAWGIRLADMVCVMALGWICARLATSPRDPVPRGLRGLSHVAASVFYYGYLNWWDTAQSELWYATLGIGALWAVRHVSRERAAWPIGGALAAAALIMKPPAIWLVAVAVVALVLRVRERRDGWLARSAVALGLFAAGSAAVVLLVFGYFGVHHALAAMKDIVVGANGYYVAHERGVNDVGDIVERTQDYLGHMQPFSTFAILGVAAGLALGVRRRERPRVVRFGTAAAVLAAGFLAVVMQQKFYMLHWGVMVGPASLATSTLAGEALGLDWATLRVRRALAVGVFGVSYAISGYHAKEWFNAVSHVVRYETGRIDRDKYAERFQFHDIGFDYADSERVGLWLRAHAEPTDLVAVRGFNPEVYAVCGLRHHGRFFWTTFLTQPSRAYRRAEWLAEDRADLDASPPRFAVIHADVPEGPDSLAYFPGYARRFQSGRLVVVERERP